MRKISLFFSSSYIASPALNHNFPFQKSYNWKELKDISLNLDLSSVPLYIGNTTSKKGILKSSPESLLTKKFSKSSEAGKSLLWQNKRYKIKIILMYFHFLDIMGALTSRPKVKNKVKRVKFYKIYFMTLLVT